MAFFGKPISSVDSLTRFSLFVFAAFFLLASGFVFFGAVAKAATPSEQGQAIFEQKCQGCHTIGGGLVLLFFLKKRSLPPSLVILSLGVVVGLAWGSFHGLSTIRLGLSLPSLSLPSLADLSTALVVLVIPQIQLTLANAVFATASTAKTYFGPEARRVTPQALLTTMGLANLAAGLIGGVPVCHGSGGLTAHYRLGARTGGAPLMLGALFIGLAVAVDGNVLPILSLIPYSVLGILTIFVGVRHSLLVTDMRNPQDILVVAVIATVALITTNLAIGFASGIALHLALRAICRYYARPVPT